MKFVTDYEVTKHEGNLELDAELLTVDQAGLATIVQTLTNQYSNTSLAAVREYSSNARDSHVEAGKAHLPIEVYLPTRLVPQLRVQDCGVGLTKHQLLKVFAAYGGSTKRDTNDLIGGMGIGSKAGFTVGNQFQVTAVKDGQKTEALFFKDDHGQPSVALLGESKTEESDGVLVDIAVENVEGVRQAADELFRTWDPGTVLVDGEEPANIWDDVQDLGSEQYMRVMDNARHTYTDTHLKVIMGGTAYAVRTKDIEHLSESTRTFLNSFTGSHLYFYVKIDIGSVDLAANREELRDTKHTKDKLNAVISQLATTMVAWVKRSVDTAKTLTEAAQFIGKLHKSFRWEPSGVIWEWKGQKIKTDHFTIPYESYHLSDRRYDYATQKQSFITRVDKHPYISLDSDLSRFIFVTGVPEGKETTVRRYTKAILVDRGDTWQHSKLIRVIPTPETSGTIEWLQYGPQYDAVESIPYEEWRKLGQKIMLNIDPLALRSKESMYTIDGETDKFTGKEIDEMGMPVAVYAYKEHRARGTMIDDALNGYVVVHLGRGQKYETLQKKTANAIWAKEVVQAHAKDLVDAMTPTDRGLINANRYQAELDTSETDKLQTLRSRIINPKVLKYLEEDDKLRVLSADDTNRLKQLTSAATMAGVTIGAELPAHLKSRIRFIKDNLPLMAMYAYQPRVANYIGVNDAKLVSDLVDYINSVKIP